MQVVQRSVPSIRFSEVFSGVFLHDSIGFAARLLLKAALPADDNRVA